MDNTPPKGVRIIVCGGRDFTDNRMLSSVLWAVHERRSIAEVIHTGQRGCAQMANRWAFEHGVHRTELRADYKRYGEKRAPVIRNRKMLELRPSGIIVFSGSAEVHSLLAQALYGGVPVMQGAEYFWKVQARREAEFRERGVSPSV